MSLRLRPNSPRVASVLCILPGAALAVLLTACGGSSPHGQAPSTPAPSTPTPSTARQPDDARGGRLYDNWRTEKGLEESFVVDSAKTPEADGKGGPNGNGTLNDAAGNPMLNSGHDYRLKNLFGWDLRGSEGIYGPKFHNKAYALPFNLLTSTRTEAELQAWLKNGGEGLPAFGSVLSDMDLQDVVAYLSKTRLGALVSPDQVFRLEPTAPKGYVLNSGGDAARGKARFAEACAGCHGSDGRDIRIDDSLSVGAISRSSGYEIWFKILNGQPGTDMGRQVNELSAKSQAQAILDLFAALCDRTLFPALPGAEAEDVPAGDARCGAYLR